MKSLCPPNSLKVLSLALAAAVVSKRSLDSRVPKHDPRPEFFYFRTFLAPSLLRTQESFYREPVTSALATAGVPIGRICYQYVLLLRTL